MKFEVNRDIENRILSVEVSLKEFGSGTLSAEAETEIYDDFGFPKVDLGGAFQSANFTGADFILNKKVVEVREGFAVAHSVKLDSLDGLDDQAKIAKAEAQCGLFEEVILERLEVAVTAVQAKASVFTSNYPKDVIV